MSTTHQQHTRDRSRQRSIDRYTESSLPHADSNSTTAGTKRLFSNRQSRLSYNSEDHGENDEPEPQEVVHSEKRHRPSDWPLTNPSPANSSVARAPLRNRNTPNSPSSRRPSPQKRPSKFLEGSMNDRVSQKPPNPYLGTDEDLLDKYEQDQQEYNRGRKTSRPQSYTQQPSVSMSGESDISRHSSIFRFGKSIAASFNPSNWKIWSKQQPEQDDEETSQQRILKERREKAERIYKELKQSGHFRDSTTHHQSHDGFGDQKLFGKHDSGVAFGDDGRNSRLSTESRISREEKRKGRVFLEPPNLSNNRRGESPASNVGSAIHSNGSSPNKQSFHFKKPSLVNIKKSFISDSASSDRRYSGEHQARRIPSRKDLQKQQKLVKRVSDLEGKLEAARRQLSEALGEPLPSQIPPKIGRTRFVPGAMPTLPSERLLNGYISSEAGFSDSEMNNEIGKAVSLDQARETAPVIPGVRNDREQSAMSSVKAEPSPSWASKPLPYPETPSQDRVVQSVEVEDKVEAQQETKLPETGTTAAGETPVKASKSNDSSYEEDTSMKDAIPKPLPAKRRANKKRKSSFEGLADDGGRYKPTSDSESDPESPVEKVTPRKKATAAPPRKLRKTVEVPVINANSPPKYPPPPPPAANTSTPNHSSTTTPFHPPPGKSLKTAQGASPSTTAGQQIPPRRTSMKGTKKAPSIVSTCSSTRLSKPKTSQKQRGRQSVSPPPSSSFTGLEYMKPSESANHTGPELTEGDDEVPPMPKLPKAVRLPSGEIVSTKTPSQVGSTTSRTSRGSKLTKTRKEAKKFESGGGEEQQKKGERMSRSQSKASFEWPEDVF